MFANHAPAPFVWVLANELNTNFNVFEAVPVIVLAPVNVPPEASDHLLFVFPSIFWKAVNIESAEVTIPAPDTNPVNTFPITAEFTKVGLAYVPANSPPAAIPDIVVKYVLLS